MSKTARDIMTTLVHTVSPSTPVKELAKAFTESGVSGFPVVDEQGRVVGVVTEADLIHQNERLHIPTTFVLLEAVIMLGSSRKLEDEMRRMAAVVVEDLMTSDPVTVSPETELPDVATLLAEKRIHTLPVVDEENRLVGVIGKLDVIRNMSES